MRSETRRRLAEIYEKLPSMYAGERVSIDEIDAATSSFVVRDIHRRDLSEVTQTIKRELKRHHFDGSGTLVRL